MLNRKPEVSSVSSHDNLTSRRKQNLSDVSDANCERQASNNAQVTSVIRFTSEEWENYIDGLNNPPKLTPKLRVALNRHLKEYK